jgi:CTP synthase
MQLAVVEFARNVCGLKGANSTEFEKTPTHPVIDLMPGQSTRRETGESMRLGAWACVLKPGTRAHAIYGTTEISERHRHRWEVNNAYREPLSSHGLVLSGTSPDDTLVEMIELADHPHLVGCQFHPEFKSRPLAAHPLFAAFVSAAVRRRDELATSRTRTEVSAPDAPLPVQ